MMLAILMLFVKAVLAYILVDALTGVYHLLTDKGWNVQQQIDLFENHHKTNSMDGFDWQPMLAAIPALVYGAWVHSEFLTIAGVIGCFAQLPHYWAHEGGGRFVAFLQATRLIISPQHHAGHHDGVFDRNYCILSGWNDWWLNALVRLLSRRVVA